MKLIDTHTHLDLEAFDEDRDEVLERSRSAGVDEWIIPALTPATARKLLDAAWRPHTMHVAAGFHPHEVKKFETSEIESLDELLSERPEIVAVGEAGLDYFYDEEWGPHQREMLERQFELAGKHSKPLILHVRSGEGAGADAYRDILALIRNFPDQRGELHSFTGTAADAATALELGWYLGVNGIVTFKKSEALREVVRAIPPDRLLLETDAPYLAPVPYRGKRNEPAFVAATADFIAKERGEDLTNFVSQCNSNAYRLFNIPK